MLAKSTIYLAKGDTAQYLDLIKYNRFCLAAGAAKTVRTAPRTV